MKTIPQFPTKRFLAIALLAGAPFFAWMFTARSEPAPFFNIHAIVTTLEDANDVNPGDGVCDIDAGAIGPQCTLRAAIQEANALFGDSTISFNPGLTGVVSLNTPLPDINANVGVFGPGGNAITIERSNSVGTPDFRLFTILSGRVVTISGVTLRNGRAGSEGGAISNRGTLTVARSFLTNNSADFGGAIFTQSHLTIIDSTIADNALSGAIFMSGGIGKFLNSTISGNASTLAGAGISFTGFSSGTIVNCTIVGNRSDFLGTSGTKGGGIAKGSVNFVELRNTIVAGNSRNAGAIPDDILGTVSTASTSNLIGIGGSGGITDGVNNNQVGVEDPRLGALADNGGPTKTHRLLPGSPAVDGGNICVLFDGCFPTVGISLTNDQRGAGFPRMVNGDFDETPRVDIGAYEAQSVLQGPAFVVTNTNDSGAGSLRQAISDASVNGGGNVITFQEGLSGAITLTTPLPELDFSVIIDGPGADKLKVQRSNAGGTLQFRIFTITLGHTVRISGLTIANGVADGATVLSGSGGGIFSEGALFIDGCVIADNRAGSGGGIATNASLTLLNSTVDNNAATFSGGGIEINSAFGGTGLRIDGSTISNNVSGDQGGGIFSSGAPPGVVTNTTISTNTAVKGGGMFSLDDLALRNVTITANHASIRGGGIGLHFNSIGFSNTIIAGNTSLLGPDGHSEVLGATFISADYNLISNITGMLITGAVAHNLHNVNPRLGPLANNGGPTKTHELLDGSPAIDAGNTTLTTDQRGLSRKVDHPSAPNVFGGDLSDIGAFEARPLEVNTISDADDGACTLPGTGNGCTLREAINAANNTPGTQTITFAPSLTTGGPSTITLLTELPQLSSDMTIAGPGAELLSVRRSSAAGTPEFRIFQVNTFRSVTISGLTIANGRLAGFGGGGVANFGELTLSNCNLYGNSAGTIGINGTGGGVYSEGSALTLINCKVGGLGPGQGNTAGASGGGVFNSRGTLLMRGGAVVGNTGDGIASGSATTIDGVTITNNIETGNGGGGLLLLGGEIKIINSLIANNTANGGSGGGIRNAATANTTIINSTFSGNSSVIDGGGIYNFNASLTLINVTITNNRADSNNDALNGEDGGGLDVAGGLVVLHNTIIAGNFLRAAANDLADGVSAASSFNVIGVCSSCGLSNGVNNNQVGVADAGLVALANNGGLTLTHALLPASPALDRGNNVFVEQPVLNGPPFYDQRGVPFSRVVDGPDGDTTPTVDVGAFEQQGAVSRIQDTKTSEDIPVTIAFDVGERSLINSITVTSSNDTLVPNDATHLSLAAFGSTELLTINPAADRSGTTNITVNINRTANSESRTFNLTVNSVNDAPTFTPGLSQNHDEDAGAFSFPYASNISAGAPDESGQILSFQITGNTNPALFMTPPQITNESGTIHYQLRPDANGIALLTVVLKDNGGTANGGKDTSVAQTFIITVNAINDAPRTRASPFTQNVNENGPLTFSNANGNPLAVLDVDLGNAPLQVTLNATNGLFTLNGTSGLSFTVGNGQANTTMTFTGSLASINAALEGSRFTPNAGYDGPAQLQIVSNDGGASGFGGPLTDNKTVFINVLNGGALQFQNSSHTVSEGMSQATITVARVGGTAGAASVTYSTSGSTATGGGVCGAGIDYVDTTGTLSWAAGDATAKTFTITVCDDSLDEPDEVLNIALSAAQGSGQVGSPGTATLTLLNDDAPVLLTEENTDHAIALDSVFPTRDPFSLTTPHNFSNDHRRRVSLFVWRLGLLPADNASNVTVVAEDSAGSSYPLTVEFVGAVPNLPGVTHVTVILPDNVIGAPRDLWLKVKLRGPGSNRAFIRIAAP